MNKIVREHYPASKLPEDLRGSIEPGASVRVTVEEVQARERMTWSQIRASLLDARLNAKGVTMEEAVARIRELRDEWDD